MSFRRPYQDTPARLAMGPLSIDVPNDNYIAEQLIFQIDII